MTNGQLWRLVPALGVSQIISWGALYYSIAVLGASMREELGLSEAALFGAYSLGLLVSGLASPKTGRLIDRYGGRTVLAVGSLLAALALFAIAHAHSAAAMYAAWCLAGLAMALTLYDPAFATLSQHTGVRYRTALTALTLMGGLASTAFWPLSLVGLQRLGWRDTLALFAMLELLVCLPLHVLFVPRLAAVVSPGRTGVGAGGAEPVRPPSPHDRRVFVALAVAFALNGFIVSVLTVHLISILQVKQLSLETAVWVGSFFGPMQVTGRILEFSVGRRFSSKSIGLLSLSLLVVAIVVLLLLEGDLVLALAFALLFGCSNGVVTIVRGTVPAELFGRAGYGALLGRLAAPALLARAVAPFLFAPIAAPGAATGPWLAVLLGMALLSVASFRLAIAGR